MLISEAVTKLMSINRIIGITRKEWAENVHIELDSEGTFIYASSLAGESDSADFIPEAEDLIADDWGLVTKNVEY